jgi:hypothetical protein
MHIVELDKWDWTEEADKIETQLKAARVLAGATVTVGAHDDMGKVVLVRTPDGATLITERPFVEFIGDAVS